MLFKVCHGQQTLPTPFLMDLFRHINVDVRLKAAIEKIEGK